MGFKNEWKKEEEEEEGKGTMQRSHRLSCADIVIR